MGNDGGSIPRRSELVKTKKKAVKIDPTIGLISKWFFCALSKKPLEAPVVVCQLGKLYNKDALLEHFIDKSKFGDADKICGHIRSLSKVQTLNLLANPAYKGFQKESKPVAPFICPLTLKEMNGNHKFVYIKSCGCVFSETGLKELQQHSNLICPSCSKSYEINKIIEILPSQEVQDKLMIEIQLAREAESLKKNKRKADKISEGSTSEKKIKADSTAAIPSTCSSKVLEVASDLLKIKEKSAAIQSIYTSSQTANKQPQNYLCKGTFNRYA